MTSSKEQYEDQRQWEAREKGADNKLTIYGMVTGMTPSRDNLALTAQRIVDAVHNGEINPLHALAPLRYLSDICAKVQKEILDDIIVEVDKHGKSATYLNVEFSKMEAGVKYDWMLCGDPVLNRLLDEQEALLAKVKERQDFLKKCPADGLSINDPETGEVVTIYPPNKSSTTTVKVGFKN